MDIELIARLLESNDKEVRSQAKEMVKSGDRYEKSLEELRAAKSEYKATKDKLQSLIAKWQKEQDAL